MTDFLNADKIRKMLKAEADVARLLATAPPDPRRFPGHILICYFIDEPDPASIHVRCDNCGSREMLGPKSARLRRENPGLFHALCAACGLAVVKLRSDRGEDVATHRPDDWPWVRS